MKLFKRAIRKIAPLAASALMLGSSLGFAAAADLASFPQPYVTSAGVADVAIIYGADSSGQDTAGAAEIVSALVVPIGTGTTTTVSIGETKDFPLNTALNDGTQGWGTSLDDSDVSSLLDEKIVIAIGDVSEDYNFHEEVELGSTAVVESGLTATSPSEKFKDRIFLEVAEDSVKYRYVFDESLSSGNYIANASSDEPIILSILGKDVEIQSATSSTLTAIVGQKVTLVEGESITIEGKTLRLDQVGSDGSIKVVVDGESSIIGNGNSLRVAGLRVKNENPLPAAVAGQIGSAQIVAGIDTTETFSSGEEFIGEDEDDPNWVWELGGLDTSTPTINVSYNRNLRDWDEDDPDSVIYKGGSLNLPNDYITISVTGFTEGTWRDYTFDTDTTRLRNASGTAYDPVVGSSTSFNTLRIKADGGDDDAISVKCAGVSGSPFETDEIYIYANSTGANKTRVYWYDHDQDVLTNNPRFCAAATTDAAMNFTLHYDDSDVVVSVHRVVGGLQNYVLEFKYASGGANALRQTINLSVNSTSSNSKETEWFGLEEGDAKASDIYVGGPALRNIGTWDYDTMTQDGLKIYTPDYYNDEFHVGIPSDERDNFEIDVTVAGKGAVTTTTGTQFTKAPQGVLVVDVEVATVKGKNIIAIGGSAVNKVSAEILGLPYPTYGGDQAWKDATGVTGAGQAIIKTLTSPYATDKVAMLVAGYSGVDTTRASLALAKGVPALSGQEALLSTVTETVTTL